METVHLTVAYAAYFAAVATCESDRMAIIEVDVNTSNLVPDEDYMEQAFRASDIRRAMSLQYSAPELTGGMEQRTLWFRDNISKFQGFWRASLNGIGNVAHAGPIDPKYIRRATFFSCERNPTMYSRALDPSITLINYAVMGPQYRALTRWFIGENVTPEVLAGHAWSLYSENAKIEFTAAVNNRYGLEVVRI